MQSQDVEHFFVYGTLAPGRPDDHVLAGLAGTWRRATVAGSLDGREWGAAQGFPGIILDNGSGAHEVGEVEGMVLSSPELGAHWERLDEFERPEYERVAVRARLEDGSAVTAQVYALR